MNRDIIYIDVDDDITAIISKIKASKEKIIALVPPKRVGVLQSAVNLKLLSRTAESADKKLVIVSHNPALVALAASASIPVAKNLQSKPEITEIKIEDNEEETVIDGSKLPVGELARTADEESIVKVHYGADVENAIEELQQKTDDDSTKKEKKPSIKVPNFGSFRKKFFIFSGLGVLLIAFLVWAFVFAPAAKIIIHASTSPEPISENITIGVNSNTSGKDNTLRVVTKQLKKELSVEFTATGIKENKASGNVVFRNCQSSSSKSVPSGTTVTDSSGLSYKTQSDVNVPGGTFDAGCTTPGVSTPVTIVAIKGGAEFNRASAGADMSVSGFASSMIARTTTPLVGGDSKTTTVVSADDINKAKEKLIALSTDSYKDTLKKQFSEDQVVISDSLDIVREEGVSTPALGEPASNAKLTSQTTFTMYGANKSEINIYLDERLAAIIAKKENYKIYDNGVGNVKIKDFSKGEKSTTAHISATAKIGPAIKESFVKEISRGKRYGEVQSQLGAINGVNSVDIQFSYFWVTTVPNSDDRITVEFLVDND